VFQNGIRYRHLVPGWLGVLCQQATDANAIMSHTPNFENVYAPILYSAIDGSARDL